MSSLSISEFKAQLAAVLERVRVSGRGVLVTRHGRPVARVLPAVEASTAGSGAFGVLAGTARELRDLLEPLAESDWEALS